MNIYRSDLIDFIDQEVEKKSMPPAIDFKEKKQRSSTYPAVDVSNNILMDANAFAFFKSNIMGMLPELAMLIEEQQALRIKEKDDTILSLKTQIDQMEFLLMNVDFSPAAKETVTFPKELSKMEQCIPNPFTDNTVINCLVPTSAIEAELVVLNDCGKIIKSVKIIERGKVQLQLDSAGLCNGTFNYQLIADAKVLHSKSMFVQNRIN